MDDVNDFLASLQSNGDDNKDNNEDDNKDNNMNNNDMKNNKEIDPLDEFMNNLEKNNQNDNKNKRKAIRLDYENESLDDDIMSAAMKYQKLNNNENEEEEEEERRRGKVINELPKIDHSQIDYAPFKKNIFTPPFRLKQRNNNIDINWLSPDIMNLIKSFEDFGFDEKLLRVLNKNGFTIPTPIQIRAIPASLLGHDIIAISKTGSGKTLSFTLPLIIHVSRRRRRSGTPPIALVLAPTRELAAQIYSRIKLFTKIYNISVCPVYGGLNKHEQFRTLLKGVDVVVATPGRFIDLIKMKACSTSNISFVVVDEADRWFSMGFLPQLKSILNQIRPDKQILLYTATFKHKLRNMAKSLMKKPLQLSFDNEISENIQQFVNIFNNDIEKQKWLFNVLLNFMNNGKVLIFVSTRKDCDVLAYEIRNKLNIQTDSLHGQKNQFERFEAINKFKKNDINVLVATDVAARGIDIHIDTVINYDIPRNLDAHKHRIGRSGRLDKPGSAYTLLNCHDSIHIEFAGILIEYMEQQQQHISPQLLQLALKNSKWKSQYSKHKNIIPSTTNINTNISSTHMNNHNNNNNNNHNNNNNANIYINSYNNANVNSYNELNINSNNNINLNSNNNINLNSNNNININSYNNTNIIPKHTNRSIKKGIGFNDPVAPYSNLKMNKYSTLSTTFVKSTTNTNNDAVASSKKRKKSRWDR